MKNDLEDKLIEEEDEKDDLSRERTARGESGEKEGENMGEKEWKEE